MEAIEPSLFFFALIYGGFILGVLTDRLILRRKPATEKRQRPNPESGSVFTMLLAGIGIAAALSLVLYQTVSGPMSSMVRVTNKTSAKSQMQSVSSIVIMDAINQPGNGDCDADGSVEPRAWRVGAYGPTNGGLLPSNIGAPPTDPWGTDYGYCVWDVGTQIKVAGCDGANGPNAQRLSGSPTPTSGNASTQTVLAIISAGPNRQFQSTCRDYVDATTDVITAGADDIVQRFTYKEAASSTSSLWALKPLDPTKAIINKDLEIGPTATPTVTVNSTTGLINALAITTQGKISSGGAIQLATDAVVTTCLAANQGDMRYNAGTKAIEVCDGPTTTWSAGSSQWITTGSDIYYNTGKVGIGTAAPASILHLSGATAPKFSMSDTGLAHGVTTFAPTDAFFHVDQVTDDAGGARLWGFSSTVGLRPMSIFGVFGNTDPTDTVPGIWLLAGKRSGTGLADLGALETALQVGGANTGTNYMTVLGSGNVGIGTTSPVSNLHVAGSGGQIAYFDNNAETVTAAVIRGRKSRGTTSAPTIVQNGDSIMALTGSGYDGSAYRVAGSIIVESDGTTGADDMPGRITFNTAADGTNQAVERMRIDNAGNVGIGTAAAAPGAKLHIVGPAVTASPWISEIMRFEDAAHLGQYGSIFIDQSGASGGMSLGMAGSRSLYIAQTTGNVGIGTTAPDSTLHLNAASGNARLHIQAAPASAPFVRFFDGTFASYVGQDGSGGNGLAVGALPYAASLVGAAGKAVHLAPNATVALTAISGGNVGIGTAAPGAKLDVYQNANASMLSRIKLDGATSYEAKLQIDVSGSTSSNAKLSLTGQGTKTWDIYNWNWSAGELVFLPNSGTAAMTMLQNGNVGIGQAPTGRRLAISSAAGAGATVNASGWAMSLSYGGAGTEYGLALAPKTDGATWAIYVGNASGGTAGGLTADASSVAYNTSSDKRLKENITDTTKGLGTVLGIKVHDFNFKSDPEKKLRNGFIAQELYKIYPDAVWVGGADPKAKPWAVDYGRITPLLVKSIQDLKAENDALEARIKKLEEKLAH